MRGGAGARAAAGARRARHIDKAVLPRVGARDSSPEAAVHHQRRSGSMVSTSPQLPALQPRRGVARTSAQLDPRVRLLLLPCGYLCVALASPRQIRHSLTDGISMLRAFDNAPCFSDDCTASCAALHQANSKQACVPSVCMQQYERTYLRDDQWDDNLYRRRAHATCPMLYTAVALSDPRP